MQMPKKREHVSLFFDFWREKVSVRELSDDFGTVYDPFLLVGETVVSRQPQRTRKASFFILLSFYGQRILADYRPNPPGRHLIRIGFAFEHDECRVVLRTLFRVNAESVREVQQAAQMAERAFGV